MLWRRYVNKGSALARILALNTFEGGTDDVTLSAANSGGASGTAFNAVSIGAGNTLTFDNQFARGTMACKVFTDVGAGTSYARWDSALGDLNEVYGRLFIYLTANPGTNFRIVSIVDSTGALTRGGIIITTAGTVRSIRGGGSTVLTTAVPITLNQWVRVEYRLIGSVTAGFIEVKLFNNPDSDTPTEVITSANNIDTGGVMSQYRFGVGTSVASIGPYWQDGIAVGVGGYIGK